MTDYNELVKALRCCANLNTNCTVCPWNKYNFALCAVKLYTDAAAAIEALQANVKRLEQERDELIGQMPELTETADGWKWKWKPHWVSVEERLPEKNGAYLVFMEYGHNWIWFKDIFMDGKFMADTCALNGAKVTHWMPIEPPQEVQE